MTIPSVLFWFRKSLRIHDNLALRRAVEYAAEQRACLLPLYVMDMQWANPDKVGVVRMNFILESLQDLDANLQKHRAPPLLVLRGNPESVFSELFAAQKDGGQGRPSIKGLFYESDIEPRIRERDKRVAEQAQAANVHIESKHGHLLYDPDWLLDQCRYRGTPARHAPRTMSAFLALLKRVGEPDHPLLVKEVTEGLEELAQDNGAWRKALQSDTQPLTVPSLAELGYPEAPPSRLFKGGESTAFEKLDEFCRRGGGKTVRKFNKQETVASDFDPPQTSTLSPYLALGCLSPREFYYTVRHAQDKAAAEAPDDLAGQLYWREQYALLGYTVPNFDRMEGNELCRQILWDESPDLVAAWAAGKTGYPFLDACMRQLVTEGWMHHNARLVAACFLTRGDLWQSWEIGAAVFEKYLIDYDWSSNVGNWLWASCSAFYHDYHDVLSPKKEKWHGKSLLSTKDFIRKYVPELARYRDDRLNFPYSVPRRFQEEFGCVIGKDYPKPIVKHEEAYRRNRILMKRAFVRHTQKLTLIARSRASGERRPNDDEEDIEQDDNWKTTSERAASWPADWQQNRDDSWKKDWEQTSIDHQRIDGDTCSRISRLFTQRQTGKTLTGDLAPILKPMRWPSTPVRISPPRTSPDLTMHPHHTHRRSKLPHARASSLYSPPRPRLERDTPTEWV
ncbi:Cryptochrome-2 [Porphyridium purpureum]|uniref:Cryptochrome-2 n=1 Tax=Porphyridium purpureum TaxID=35688 RepID=A0A5J4YNU2_PORPP|nr:Cryptochrome-2 [Porphyridium purpureum]|eukprot:POR6299..scf295_9